MTYEYVFLDDLKSFDSEYAKQSRSKIFENNAELLNCREFDVVNFELKKD